MADVVERLEAAIDALYEHITETVATGAVSPRAVVVALRMMPAVRDLLRHDLALVKTSEGERLEKVLSAFEYAGDAALVDAVLSGGPLLPSERARAAVFGLDRPEPADASG